MAVQCRAPRAAVAQLPTFEAGANSLAIQLGAASPLETNRFDKGVRNGRAARIQFLHFALDWIAWGFDFGYSKFARRVQGENTQLLLPIPPATELGLQADVLQISALARVNLVSDRPWTPYLLGAVGLHEFSAKADWVPPVNPAETRSRQEASSRGMSASGAAGLEGFVMKNISLSFEARFDSLQLSRRRFTLSPVESMSYLVGFRYWFGYRR
ncbi:MAG: hypothetical protein HY551_07370 [Elusimicrobia bacterium]|nr:hypothetical protein [Elusimicrobiota bacterium]